MLKRVEILDLPAKYAESPGITQTESSGPKRGRDLKNFLVTEQKS